MPVDVMANIVRKVNKAERRHRLVEGMLRHCR